MDELKQTNTISDSKQSRWLNLSKELQSQWGVIAAVVVGVVLTFTAQLFVFSLLLPFDEQIEQNQLLDVFRDQLLLVSALIPLGIYFTLKGWPFFKSVLISKFRLGYIEFLLKGAGLYLVLTVIGLLFVQLFAPEALEVEQDIGIASGDPMSVLIVAFVSVVILAPFVEEVLFRGFIFRGFEKTIGFGLAVVASSLLFGLLHGGLAAAVDTFALGVVGCLLVARSGSLWPAILLHGLKNVIVYYNRFIEPIL